MTTTTQNTTAQLIAYIASDPYGNSDNARYQAAYSELERRADDGDDEASLWFH